MPGVRVNRFLTSKLTGICQQFDDGSSMDPNGRTKTKELLPYQRGFAEWAYRSAGKDPWAGGKPAAPLSKIRRLVIFTGGI
jgi:hypothetical protein